MPTKRKLRRRNAVSISTFEELHLLHGCCLTCCKLCHFERSRRFQLRWRIAESAWKRYRYELLAMWRRPINGERLPGFRNGVERGYGAYFPCFAEVLFDNALWPGSEDFWPDEVKEQHELIETRIKTALDVRNRKLKRKGI